jgi:hypothetical protein
VKAKLRLVEGPNGIRIVDKVIHPHTVKVKASPSRLPPEVFNELVDLLATTLVLDYDEDHRREDVDDTNQTDAPI